ncbi:MAG TPA: YfhO family protein [Bacteroidales bacterium]|nr:YfhO family protein [Bacteroidales bacterium]
MNYSCFRSAGEYLKSEKSFDLKAVFFLFIITIAGYYNVSLLIHPLKWDIIDQAYPYRFLIGECLQNNTFPYWQPFQQFGLPFYADPASGVWYPLTWIFGWLTGYNIYTIPIEYILHIFLAATGFYLLGKTLGFTGRVALVLAVGYAFSGFIVGNSQHLVYVISACWIPYVLNSYIHLARQKRILYAFTTALFLYLLTTGGYPALLIIFGYHLLAIFIGYTVFLLIKKRYKDWLKYAKLNLVTFLIYGILTFSFFISVLYNQDSVARLNDTRLEDVLFSPFSPQCLVSLVAPYAVTGNMEYFDTDFSMANAYFGIILLAFFILYFFQKKSKLSILILLTGILNLLVAFGGYLPFREFLYHYGPFMNLFRFPSVFRYFTIVSFLLVAGFSIQVFMENRSKKLFFTILALIFAFALTMLMARFNDYLNIKNIALDLAWKFPNGTTILQRIALQLIIQMGLLILFLIAWWFSKINMYYLLLIFVVVDMFVATRLNSNCTVYYEEFSSKNIRAFEKQNFVKGFPVPDRPITEYSDSTGSYQCFWRNLSSYYKRPAFDGYNSFSINTFEKLKENHYPFFKEIKKNKLFYFADTVIHKFDSVTALNYGRQGMVFTENKAPVFKSTGNKGRDVKITAFSPNNISAETEGNDSSFLVFIQNYNKGWQATINNTPVKIYRANLTLNAIVVPPGKNKITFSYKPLPVIIAGYVSLVGLLSLVSILICLWFRKSMFSEKKPDI